MWAGRGWAGQGWAAQVLVELAGRHRLAIVRVWHDIWGRSGYHHALIVVASADNLADILADILGAAGAAWNSMELDGANGGGRIWYGTAVQHSKERPVRIIVEPTALPGVKRVAQKLANDFEQVSGVPALVVQQSAADANAEPVGSAEPAGYPGLAGSKDLVNGVAPVQKIVVSTQADTQADNTENKYQAFELKFTDDSTLAVIGTDLLGTEYGLYAISEYIGVSPLHFWGDVQPVHQDVIEINRDIEQISSTPSVKYRGFFINDEWPGFGSWTFEHFGGFTAEMYDHVFDLLLRLKGNYLWPAMWTSSFALDGPGDLTEVLADEYGITIGASHHEPLLRASEEWAKVSGADTPYGADWNYLANKDGLLNYWHDGLKRSGHLNKMITLGIRGEYDSELLGPDASLQANIDLLKDAITEQRKLIAQDATKQDNPQMLALYKEVEVFYYGSDTAVGLQGWDGLDGVTLMFCEDNFGFMRSLPETERERANAGMYYHLDYHGGPVSYEWMPSTSWERMHDQMSLAYDYGIKEVWVVNVGDLKFNEVPLAFFMAMAYDMAKYGSHNKAAVSEYTKQWLAKTFRRVPADIRAKMSQVLHGYIKLNAMRRPEALNAEVYHAAHYLEADRILQRAEEIQRLDQEVVTALANPKSDELASYRNNSAGFVGTNAASASLDTTTALTAYQSLIGIPARASTNLVQLMVWAAKNAHYAQQGKPIANSYADLVTQAINRDRAIGQEIKEFRDGKWSGQEKEAHIGFTMWNDDGNKYPLRLTVEPVGEPRILVSRADQERRFHKTYFAGDPVMVDDFNFAGTDRVILEIANDGTGEFDFEITGAAGKPWLTVEPNRGTVTDQQQVALILNRDKLPAQPVHADLTIVGGGTEIPVNVTAQPAPTANTPANPDLPAGTYLPGPGFVTAIPASGFSSSKAATPTAPLTAATTATPSATAPSTSAKFEVVPSGGRDGDAIRVYPTTAKFDDDLTTKRPTVTYRALITKPGDYTVQVWQVPTGVVGRGTALRFVLGVDGARHLLTAVAADVNAGYPDDSRWAEPVLRNIRITSTDVTLSQGVHQISIGAVDPNLLVERIVLYPTATPPPASYLGPPDSARA